MNTIDGREILGYLASGEPVVDRKQSHLGAHPEVSAVLPEALAKIDSQGRTRFGEQVDMGRTVGKSACVQTGADDRIVYAVRQSRLSYTRLVEGRDAEDTPYVTVWLLYSQEVRGYILITAWIGQNAPNEPWHPAADMEVFQFWATHALVWGSGPVLDRTTRKNTPFFFRKFRSRFLRKSFFRYRKYFPVR